MPVIRTMASARALALGLLASAPPSARADVFIVTYEAATVQNTTVPLSDAGVETFDGQPVGTNETFTTNFGTGADPITITGTYTGAQISAATYYGGAGGTGNYAVTFSPQGYSLALSAINNSTSASVPITYFGFWLSALDSGNQVAFYNGATEVFTFDPAQVTALVGTCPSTSNPYCGNPNPAFLGGNDEEPYVFLNFWDTSGSFTTVVFSEDPSAGGYESDNQTVGFYVPEPASLALLGAGLAGLILIRRKRVQ